jgi:hypothetical protein
MSAQPVTIVQGPKVFAPLFPRADLRRVENAEVVRRLPPAHVEKELLKS